MKKMTTLLVTSILIALNSLAATVYTVSSNKDWATLVGAACSGCTFNISSGVTFTLNTGSYCANCTFNGGTLLLANDFTVQQSAFVNNTIVVNGQKLSLQGGGTDNSFSGVTLTANGSGSVLQTAKTTITNSYFSLSGLAQYFENGGQLDITASRLYLTENASFYANAGPVNLNSSSSISAGDGSTASKAYIYLNGPQLTLVDAGSTFSVANSNNYYFNWSAYKSTSNGLSFNTSVNTANCNTAGKNSCSAPKYYGCAMFSKTGATNCTVLSAMISGFSGTLVSGNQVKLSWSLQSTDDGSIAIEHSSDAVHFEVIHTMPTGPGQEYSFSDINPSAGANYYRVTLTGFDGVKTVSGILTVQAATTPVAAGIRIYPNPVTNGRFYVRLPTTAPALLSVFSQDGRLLAGSSLSGQTEYLVVLPELTTTGLLVVRIISGDQTTTCSVLNKR